MVWTLQLSIYPSWQWYQCVHLLLCHTALSCLPPLVITFSLLWCSQCSFTTYSHLYQLVGLERGGKNSDALTPPPPCRLWEQTSPQHTPKDGLGWSREATSTLSPSLFAQSSFWLPFLPFNLSGYFHPGCPLPFPSSWRLPANPSSVIEANSNSDVLEAKQVVSARSAGPEGSSLPPLIECSPGCRPGLPGCRALFKNF